MAERRPRPGESLSFDFSLFAEKPPPSAGPAAPPSAPPPSVGPASSPPASLPPVSVSPASAPKPASPEEPRVLTVAQLSRSVGRSLERSFPDNVWVEGEVSGARPAPSGHVYFALKDEEEEATVDVVLYRSSITPRSRSLVKDGARLRVRGKPSYWAPRGKLQFIGDRVEPTGKGVLLEALEKLKAKLAAEGLFAAERKRPLPHDPRVVGVVTSATGAVIHDICKVAFRRGGASILLAPAQVQGAGAVESIRRALRMLSRAAEVDVVILARGGGSQDDLLAFHDEDLVRDVAAYRVPVVSAVGHEVDVTLVDFAADARAATPSQAAEMVVPDANARRRLLEERATRLRRAMQTILAEERSAASRLAQRFGDPRLLIANAQQRIDDAMMRLEKATSRRFARERDVTSRLAARLGAAHPRERIARDQALVSGLGARLAHAGRRIEGSRRQSVVDLNARLDRAPLAILAEDRRVLGELAGRLDAMSPLAVLARGYAIATRVSDGHAIRDSGEVAPGDRVRVRVARGDFDAEVLAAPATAEKDEAAITSKRLRSAHRRTLPSVDRRTENDAVTNPLRFAVIGSPVAHSKSPAMHGAAFRALGLPHIYEKLETAEHELADRVASLRDGTYAGLNVTVPHKVRILALVDEQDESVLATGAANTLVRQRDGSICAYNTDGPALAAEIGRLAGDPSRLRGRRGLVIGSGGAARAAIWALGRLGMIDVAVRARASGSLAAPEHEDPKLGVIVQATSCGMHGAAPGEIVADAVAWSTVPRDAVALDVVYAPPRTPFLECAAAAGLAHDGGLGMLARQGAAAFELWLGAPPPLDVMLAALA